MIHWFSHDSIGLGEDGPTHQPVEQLASLRAMPGLNVIRPCRRQRGRRGVAGGDGPQAPAGRPGPDPPERAGARPLQVRLGRGASARRLRARRSRGRRARGDPDRDRQRGVAGGRRLREADADGVRARVVSLPSWYLFDLQEQSYRESVLPAGVQARVAVEQASTLGWDRYVGPRGSRSGCTPSAPRRR